MAALGRLALLRRPGNEVGGRKLNAPRRGKRRQSFELLFVREPKATLIKPDGVSRTPGALGNLRRAQSRTA